MMTTRAVGLGPALRKAAFTPRTLARTQPYTFGAILTKRSVQTQSLPPSASEEILNAQRIHRPSSPHFTIYQPQLTWIGSIANRITGAALSVLLYGFSLAFLTFPVVDMPFTSATIIEYVSSLPEGVKLAAKTLLAAPFAFHSWNGLRHLSWDVGRLLSLKGAYRSGYAVLAATAVSTIALVLL